MRRATPTSVTALPSLSPMPDAGSLAELALRFQACDIDCHSSPGLVVLTDGRVLRMEDDEMVERQLTSTGMQQIGEALEATGLMGQDGAYHPYVNPGKEGLSAFGPESLHFDVRSGDTLAHVVTSGPGPFEGDNQRFGAVWTDPARGLRPRRAGDQARAARRVAATGGMGRCRERVHAGEVPVDS